MSILTSREYEVLDLLVLGHSIPEMAGKLYISESTVKSHLSLVYQKLGARNGRHAVTIAHRTGLLVPESLTPAEKMIKAQALIHEAIADLSGPVVDPDREVDDSKTIPPGAVVEALGAGLPRRYPRTPEVEEAK